MKFASWSCVKEWRSCGLMDKASDFDNRKKRMKDIRKLRVRVPSRLDHCIDINLFVMLECCPVFVMWASVPCASCHSCFRLTITCILWYFRLSSFRISVSMFIHSTWAGFARRKVPGIQAAFSNSSSWNLQCWIRLSDQQDSWRQEPNVNYSGLAWRGFDGSVLFNP